MKKNFVESYVLHSRPFKETSLIFNLFSLQKGRFSLIAKGIKRKNAQAQRAVLQPFNLLNIEYVGNSELKILSNVELVRLPQVSELQVLSNRALACGYYLNELLIRSLQEWQEFEGLFEAYDSSIKALHSNSVFSAILRKFEVTLLNELGIAPQWDVDINGDVIRPDKYYYFNPEEGFELVNKNLHSMNSDEFNKGFNGTALLSLANDDYKPENSRECQQITQMMLREIIGNKPLESRKLWL